MTWTFHIPFEMYRVFPTTDTPGPITLEQARIQYDKDCHEDFLYYETELKEEEEYQLFKEQLLIE